MRIAFLSHYALPHVGGTEAAIDGIARELSRRGHDVVHIASDAGPRPSASGDYRVVRVPAVNVLEQRFDVPYPLFGPRLLRVLKSEIAEADVVHAHGFLFMSSVLGLGLAKRGNRKPVRVLTEHVAHVAYESRVLDRAEWAAIATIGRFALRATEGIVVYNTRVGEQLAALAPGRRVDFIPNGVDVDRFRPAEPDERQRLRSELGWNDGLARVLCVGRLVQKKGIDLALSVADAADGEFELVLAGPGELPRPAGPSVRLLGPQSHEQLEGVYRAADAFLLPSRGEGFPLSVQEAMASGLPVVLCRDPGYGPQLEGAGEAATLTEADPDALAAAVRALLNSESRRASAGRAAAEHARRVFSWARAGDQHEALYERLRAERAA